MPNYHHLFFSFILILTLIYLTSSYECDGHSNQDDTPFNTKVDQSPYVFIGSSLNKNIDIHIPNLFNVTFLVRCILKGRPIQRIIHIVQAGLLLGRHSCQKLDVDREYIVFLEPFFSGTYRPVDFEEIPYNNQIDTLLEKTCGLLRIYPLNEPDDTDAILTNRCPSAVSIDCPSGTSTTTVSSVSSSTMLGRDSIDYEALALLLADHQRYNLNLTFLQSQNHKSLFSDEHVRQNQANHYSFMFITILIQFLFCSIILRCFL